MALDLHAFLDEFRDEAGAHLRALDAQLLALERVPDDPAPIRAMFLAAHSLKGAGGMMDLADVEALAHAAEEVLAQLRDGRQRLDAPTADRLFRAFDLLGERIARSLPGAAPIDPPIAAMIAALADIDRGTAGREVARRAAPPATYPPTTPQGAPHDGPKALLVEDSPTVRLLHAALLADIGCTVDVASDGREALALLGARHYDLIVSGLELRGSGGVFLAASLHGRAGGRIPPFILMQNDDADQPAHPEPFIAARLRTESLARQRLTTTARDLLGPVARS